MDWPCANVRLPTFGDIPMDRDRLLRPCSPQSPRTAARLAAVSGLLRGLCLLLCLAAARPAIAVEPSLDLPDPSSDPVFSSPKPSSSSPKLTAQPQELPAPSPTLPSW